ncbi:MAG: hypothetical protein M3362_25430 [Acidobacteriota bacterium]|nr:hypothetical protein [Acidobacteriota bacterium]
MDIETMNSGIYLKKIWFDKDVVELKIDSSDGNSLFSNKVYVGHKELDDLIAGLNTFRDHVHGGIYNIKFGAFGPEYANGAFNARLHFQEPGKIYVTVNTQSEFQEFGIKSVASEATLYFTTEPVLLDNFIAELRVLRTGLNDEAKLEAA